MQALSHKPRRHVRACFRGEVSLARLHNFPPPRTRTNFTIDKRSSQQDGNVFCKEYSLHILTSSQAKDADEIEATAWTLLFKYGKYTILLFAEPTTPFSQIKADLLATLRERYPNGLETAALEAGDPPTMTAIPDSILDIALAVPKDQYKLEAGWDELDVGNDGGKQETPQNLQLKDGARLAFAFIDENDENDDAEVKFHVKFADLAELYGEDE